jgi:hypothetical protein
MAIVRYLERLVIVSTIPPVGEITDRLPWVRHPTNGSTEAAMNSAVTASRTTRVPRIRY